MNALIVLLLHLLCFACGGYGTRMRVFPSSARSGLVEAQLPRARLPQMRSDRKANWASGHGKHKLIGAGGLLSIGERESLAWHAVGSRHRHGVPAKSLDAKHARISAGFPLREAISKVAKDDEEAASWISNRRVVFGSFAAFCGQVFASTNLLPASAVTSDDVEYTVPMARLTEGLATAPPQDVVITGCNSGVGLAGAKLLVAAGHRVVCACRTRAKADVAASEIMSYVASTGASARSGGSVRAAECDLASLASVRAFAKSLEGSRIDTLVLNAGLSRGVSQKEPTRTTEGFEETIGVNHLGHFLLANLLTRELAASEWKRIVVTASPVHDPKSGGGDVGPPATLGDLSGLARGADFEMADGGKYDADKAYKDSKLCNMMFMAEASRRFAARGITVNAFSPGLIADPKGFFRNQNQLFATVFNFISKLVGVAETNEFGGSALAYLAVDPALEGVTGTWFDSKPPGKHQLAVHAPSEEARRVESQGKLWALSSKLVGLAA